MKEPRSRGRDNRVSSASEPVKKRISTSRHVKKLPSAIACVLFDLDGTLIDTVDLIYRSFDYAIKTVLDQNLPKAKLLQNLGRPLAVQMKIFSEAKADELMEAYNRHNLAEHDANISAYPNVASTLAWLKKRQRTKTGVVTSKKRQLALRGLEITGLLDYIDLVIAMEDTARHKPDGEPVAEALRRLGCEPGAAVFVGDSPFDMAAGRAAGTYIAAAYWGPFDPEELRAFKPDVDLTDMSQLREWL